jgi:hypothetical protein
MNNNIYSGNQHHKKCFSDGSCKLKCKVYNSIYSVCAVFTYWYMDIYDIPEKLWDYRIHDAIHIYKDTKN